MAKVRVYELAKEFGVDSKTVLAKLKEQGATSFVLDLRSNPGGLLDQAIQVSDIFVDQGTIVTTVLSSVATTAICDNRSLSSQP